MCVCVCVCVCRYGWNYLNHHKICDFENIFSLKEIFSYDQH